MGRTKVIPLGWSWLVIWGTAGTIALAWLLGPLLEPAGVQAERR